MKNAVMLLISAVMGVLTLAIVMTVFGRVNRSTGLQSNLSAAMEMTLERSMEEQEVRQREETASLPGNPAAGSAEEASVLAQAECVAYMASVMDADTGMTVKVYAADVKKGVLSMKAVADYMHPNGTDGRTEWQRTVIYDKKQNETPVNYEVAFYRNKADMLGEGVCYKSMVVREGDVIHPPAEPAGAGADFAGWKDINDYMADFSCPVEQRLTYYADWE